MYHHRPAAEAGSQMSAAAHQIVLANPAVLMVALEAAEHANQGFHAQEIRAMVYFQTLRQEAHVIRSVVVKKPAVRQ